VDKMQETLLIRLQWLTAGGGGVMLDVPLACAANCRGSGVLI